jgi:hypothetical protein
MNSFVLVKNIKSNADVLVFTDFKLVNIRSSSDYDLKRSQQLFPKIWPMYEYWIYIRSYDDDNCPESISIDIEDTLLLLRLFKQGDLVFLQPCIENERGELFSQLPYRVMADVPSAHKYEFQQEECSAFEEFARELKSMRNWSSVWFQIARRFFLYGGGKEYRPHQQEIDRIVDYFTTLESVLVPERDGFTGRRLRERAVLLLGLKENELDNTKRLLKKFYDVRSTIVHGSDISSIDPAILNKDIDLEVVLRRILVKALRALPEEEKDRVSYLKTLFDVTDEDRAELVFSDFCKIKNESEKSKCFERITNRVRGNASK